MAKPGDRQQSGNIVFPWLGKDFGFKTAFFACAKHAKIVEIFGVLKTLGFHENLGKSGFAAQNQKS
ncbi:MAG: hypothetical protein AABX74_04045 [Nanoarchaeota archaeon]